MQIDGILLQNSIYDLENIFVKGQIVNILGFVCLRVSVTTVQLSFCSTKVATENI